MTDVVSTIAELRAAEGPERAVVMTMGALHEGHLRLVDRARELVGAGGQVVVTVFVNPLQFGPGEDFDRYPRTLEADVAACRARGVDVVFAPTAREMYPAGPPQTTVVPGNLAVELEGRVRPGHFAGMLTVVLKLLNITAPAIALFGEKDYQQLALIRQMVADFDVPSRIVGVPTVREADGLAMSSRNAYLSPAERRQALALSRALDAGVAAAASGAGASEVEASARAELAGLEVDYVAVRSLQLSSQKGPGTARLLVAARVGRTRLIDNCAVELAGTSK